MPYKITSPTVKKIMFIFSATFLAAAVIFIYSCKKNNEDKDQTTALDNATAENAFNDVFKQVDDAAKQTSYAGANKVMQLDSGGCATITITPFDTVNWPKTLTIDFGTTNCLCSDGRFRRGKVYASLTGRYRDSATVITVTLDQYYVNNYHIEGAKTITNNGHVGPVSGGLLYTVNVVNGIVTSPTGKQVTWNSTRTREWIEGEDTGWPNWQDDVYLIDGSASGVDQNGNNYTVTITSPLRVALNCKWIESGTVEIIPDGLATRTVDFGTGACDDQAAVTVNGVTYNFTMN